jgi:hypothetical protein
MTDWLRFAIDQNGNFSFHISICLLIIVFIVCLSFFIAQYFGLFGKFWFKEFEIDEAEFGLGNHKIKIRPNNTDIQIAYQIWTELSTRKIGLEIDSQHDVITEVYDSWYVFFSITRELIKTIPASKFKHKDTERIVNLSIDILNKGIRPHLTIWQAQFRRWYENELDKPENEDLSPQEIQRKYKKYNELTSQLTTVNKRLISYRNFMYEIITS